MQTTARALPSGLTRYTGTAPIGAVDAAGNVFHAFQAANDVGMVVMVEPGGRVSVVPTPPIKGRPGLLCDPFAGLWILGNKEGSDRSTPPLYPVAAFVVRGVAPGGGVPATSEEAAELPNMGFPYTDNVAVFGNGVLGAASSWAEFLRAGWFVLRMNKLVAALAQLQRGAKARGELR